jgi:hypothetical protein
MLPDECQLVVFVMCEAPAQADEDFFFRAAPTCVVLNED